jgi:hypothetical protein
VCRLNRLAQPCTARSRLRRRRILIEKPQFACGEGEVLRELVVHFGRELEALPLEGRDLQPLSQASRRDARSQEVPQQGENRRPERIEARRAGTRGDHHAEHAVAGGERQSEPGFRNRIERAVHEGAALREEHERRRTLHGEPPRLRLQRQLMLDVARRVGRRRVHEAAQNGTLAAVGQVQRRDLEFEPAMHLVEGAAGELLERARTDQRPGDAAERPQRLTDVPRQPRCQSECGPEVVRLSVHGRRLR